MIGPVHLLIQSYRDYDPQSKAKPRLCDLPCAFAAALVIRRLDETTIGSADAVR